MAKTEPVNWQPISQIPLIASMISTSLTETREHLGTLTKAKDRPHLLDDATIDRVEQVHTEQMEFVGIYSQQIARWRAEKLPQRRSANWIAWIQNQQLREATKAVLDLAGELRKGTIDRVLGMSNLELGLQALLQTPLSGRR
jgi:hypothetical protein